MNVRGELKGEQLILTIDLSAKAQKQARPSSTGKTKLIATTNGFINYGHVKVSLNATIPLK
ncbi:hypothetical protein SAMN05216338_107922 [Bradyrhizobium sp. Rc2d]|uniref:hypothetical protein n=1 Tax=Bradyrhizobium sp. Rc2d TaxID=1855321 RepID=UPI00088FBF56|nr:hypothetical protein [Bradyrhizobium sp. Rc2d]SDK00531.1 hypothetical protein SAMN05216338_107922 [Bradyrhizobium sp. Rc2d]